MPITDEIAVGPTPQLTQAPLRAWSTTLHKDRCRDRCRAARALCTFKKNMLAALHFFAEHAGRIVNVGAGVPEAEILIGHRLDIGWCAAGWRICRSGFFELVGNPRAQPICGQQIAHPHTATRHFGFMRWPDPRRVVPSAPLPCSRSPSSSL